MVALEKRLPPDAGRIRSTGNGASDTGALIVEQVAEITEGAEGASSPQEATSGEWFHRVPSPGVRYYFFEQ